MPVAQVPQAPRLTISASSAELLNDRIRAIHEEVRAHFPFVVRLAVALYDPATDQIKTFVGSPRERAPLKHYATQLEQATWLDALRRQRRSRVIDDLQAVDLGTAEHTQQIARAAFKSSYTVPVFDGGDTLVGFVFFDADRVKAFAPAVTRQLDLFVRIIALMVENTLQAASTLVGSVHLLREVSRFRDAETAYHLSRMAYYSGLIARHLAGSAARDDEWVEHVRLFAPLHDIGKIGIPDEILLKPGPLTPEEFAVMKQHPARGETILRALVESVGMKRAPRVAGLLAIARHHHECWDGSGYPDGLRGEAIPLEARIVKVADVFDALTSRRCYKAAWTVEQAVDELRRGRGAQFDPGCVDILLARLAEVREIMARFAESYSEAT